MRSRSVVLGLLFSFIPLSNVGFLEGQAEARPIRRPGVHALLLDLAQIEAFNGERDDQRTGQQIHQQIIAVRINLLRTLADQERFHTGGRAAMEGLFNMALLNNRSFDRDPEVVWRIAGSIEHMRQRLEQLMTRHGQYRPVPVPRDYRVPSGYQPPVYRGPIWDPFQGGYMPTFPGQGPATSPSPYQPQPQQTPPPPYQPVPPVYQHPSQQHQPPVYQQTPPPGYQPPPQPQPPVYQQTPPPHSYPHTQAYPVDPGQFAQLLSGMKRLSFSDEKYNYARDLVSSGHFFTCEQIVQLMRTATFGEEQVKIGAMLYPRAVDPQNFMQLTSSLTFESDRQKLRRMLGK